jgi:tetratricopeptide (TPR) repeat protein
MADILVSYTSSDRDWAFWIGQELVALGHVPHIHEWEIKGGDDIYGWMEKQLDAASHVLCVVSDEYLKAPFSTLERHAALWQMAKNRPGFVVLVAVRLCKLPALSDHFLRCELFGIPEDAARLRFREFMTRGNASETVAFPGNVFAVSNITVRVPEHFIGRDDALTAVEASLKRRKGRVTVTVVHGLRGAGKTTLAAAYAEKHRGGYRAIWWISAQTEPTIRADLVALGVRLGWVKADDKEEPALAAVMERLRNEGEGILLVYDNAIDAASLKPYLPPGGAAEVLVTSNAHAWRGVVEPVEVRLWPKEIGADYLIARTERSTERAAAETLSEALGGLPLAHEQAAAYCERLDISLAEYQKRFEAAPVRLLDTDKDAPGEYHGGLTAAKTFALAIDEAAKLHPAAEPLIVHAALLAPEPIPLFFFAEAREKLGEPLASALANDGLDEAVAALRSFALAERETIPDERDPSNTSDCIRLHRLVREVAAARAKDEAREDMLRGLIEAMAVVYTAGVYYDPQTWPRARRLTALALALVGGDTTPPKGAERQVADLLFWLYVRGSYMLTEYAGASALLEQALAIRERVLGPEHPDTAASLNVLGGVKCSQGDFKGARPLYDRALAIREKVLGPEHPDTAQSLNNLACLLHAQGDYEAARPLFERSLAILEKTVGPDHPDTANSLRNLARLLGSQGDYSGARPLLGRALAICEKVLGPDDPQSANSLAMLAGLLQSQGENEGARPLLQRTLAIYENVLGPEHSNTKTCAAVTAKVLDALGRTGEAAALRARFALQESKASA